MKTTEQKLIAKLEAYIRFLNKANEGALSMAWVHGWRCHEDQFKKGVAFRKSIKKLKERVNCH